MDKVTLTQDQLKLLVRFIYARGFKEPLAVMDILDHFACKVEERMAADTKLTVGQAMEEAHLSFGVTGFRKLVVAHAGQFNARYKRTYAAIFRQVFTSPKQMIGIMLATGLFYTGYSLCSRININAWGFNLCSIMLYAIFIAGQVAVQASTPRKYLRHTADADFGNWNWIAFAVFFALFNFTGVTMPTHLPAWLCAAAFLYFALHFTVERKTVKKLFSNYRDIERLLSQMH